MDQRWKLIVLTTGSAYASDLKGVLERQVRRGELTDTVVTRDHRTVTVFRYLEANGARVIRERITDHDQ
jgi:hypothetical protein